MSQPASTPRGVLRRPAVRPEPFVLTAEYAADFPFAAPPPPAPPVPEAPDMEALRAAFEAEAAEASAAHAEALEAARREAYDAGYAAAREALAQEALASVQAEAEAAAERLAALWAEGLRQTEPHLAALAVDAAESLLGLPLPEPMRAALRAALFQAIEELAATGPATVSLHPVDYLHLQEAGFVEQLSAAHPGLRWAPSPALAESDWTLDAPEAAVRRVRAELAAHLHAHLGLDAAAADAP